MLVVTAQSISGYRIVKTLGLVMAIQEFKLARPRKAVYQAITEIVEQAKNKGANAIIALKINSLNNSGDVSAVVVYGTAVIVEKNN